MSVNIVSLTKCILYSELTQNEYLKQILFVREPMCITSHAVPLFQFFPRV